MTDPKEPKHPHSPTPWQTMRAEHGHHVEIVTNRGHIGLVFMGSFGDGSTGEGNLRFIMRATHAHDALVEALLLSTFWLTRVGNFHMTPGATITAKCLADGVDADISKGELEGVAERVAANDAILAAAKGAKP